MYEFASSWTVLMAYSSTTNARERIMFAPVMQTLLVSFGFFWTTVTCRVATMAMQRMLATMVILNPR